MWQCCTYLLEYSYICASSTETLRSFEPKTFELIGRVPNGRSIYFLKLKCGVSNFDILWEILYSVPTCMFSGNAITPWQILLLSATAHSHVILKLYDFFFHFLKKKYSWHLQHFGIRPKIQGRVVGKSETLFFTRIYFFAKILFQ